MKEKKMGAVRGKGELVWAESQGRFPGGSDVCIEI